MKQRTDAEIHRQSIIGVERVIFSGFGTLIGRTDSCVPGLEIRETAGETLRIRDIKDWRSPIGLEQKLSSPVNRGKTGHRLCKVKQQVTPGFNIIVRIDTEYLFSVWHRFDVRLIHPKIYATGFGSQREILVRRACRDCLAEGFFKPEHMIICLDFQTVDRSVGFGDFKNAHRNRFFRAVIKTQMIEKFHLCTVQCVTVDCQGKCKAEFGGIHRTQLNLTASAALMRDVAAALDDVGIGKCIYRTFYRSNGARP